MCTPDLLASYIVEHETLRGGYRARPGILVGRHEESPSPTAARGSTLQIIVRSSELRQMSRQPSSQFLSQPLCQAIVNRSSVYPIARQDDAIRVIC